MAAIDRVGIIGGGAWGTALATVLHRAGRSVVLWARDPAIVEAIARRRENPVYLPGVDLDPAIRATGDLAEAARADAVFLVVPAQHLRRIAERLRPHLGAGVPVVLCAKGIEQGSAGLMTEVVAEALPGAPQVVLSGPTFAREVAAGLPTAVTLATTRRRPGERLRDAIDTPRFRPYLSDDPVGAELGGAVKNVLAVACGIAVGRRLGDNARAALITRGLAETIRLALAKGGKAETLMGLSGLGDLTLTCTSLQSRNFSLGVALGEGHSLDELLAERRSVAEGVWSAAALVALARRLGVEMPIAAAVDRVINHGADLEATITGLLARPLGAEWPVSGQTAVESPEPIG
jgi:glycerol-3-phosphate dehydrogenase (NAD(P)+)